MNFSCVRVVPVHTGTFRTYTRRRVEWTHGVFQRVTHDTPHRTHTHHNTTQHNNTTTTPHGDRDRDRQRQTERPRKKTGTEREEKTKEDKTRQDKRREQIHFQCGGAWPFFVHGVLCLVKPVNARFLSLLNSVKYDSSLISLSALWPVKSF